MVRHSIDAEGQRAGRPDGEIRWVDFRNRHQRAQAREEAAMREESIGGAVPGGGIPETRRRITCLRYERFLVEELDEIAEALWIALVVVRPDDGHGHILI